MKGIAVVAVAGSLLLGTVVAQTSSSSQASVSTSENTSASTNKSDAELNSKSSANVAQSAGVSGDPAAVGSANQLESGRTIHATLVKPVDSRKNRPGDPVLAKTTEDVKSNGQIMIPRGSKIMGHVTEAKAYEKGQVESALAVAFDYAVLKDGSHLPLSLRVQAVTGSATSMATQTGEESVLTSGTGSVSGGAPAATRSGGGLVGGVGSTTGALVNTGANIGGSAAHATSGLGAGTSSSLNSSSQGVIGLRNLNLASSTSTSNSGTFTSPNSNVHLDSGTQMILRVQK